MERIDDIISDGLNLAFYSNNVTTEGKATPPKAVVLIVHGYAEHMRRYTHVGALLNDYNMLAYGIDLRGHGASEGERAYIQSFTEYCQDVMCAIDRVQELYAHLPLFLLGHSNGGLVAVKTVLDRSPDLAGMILSGAALKIDDDLSPVLRRLAPLIGRLFPRLKAVKLDSKLVSRDPQVVEAYESDPLVYSDGIKAGYGAAVLSAIKDVGQRFGAISCPLLIMHGEADKLTDPRGSLHLADMAGSSDITTKIWPGLYHEILNEPEKEEVLTLMAGWILERC